MRRGTSVAEMKVWKWKELPVVQIVQLRLKLGLGFGWNYKELYEDKINKFNFLCCGYQEIFVAIGIHAILIQKIIISCFTSIFRYSCFSYGSRQHGNRFLRTKIIQLWLWTYPTRPTTYNLIVLCFQRVNFMLSFKPYTKKRSEARRYRKKNRERENLSETIMVWNSRVLV